jgi:hypothetical protein
MKLSYHLKIIPILMMGVGIPLVAASQIEMPSSVLGNGGSVTSNSQYQINGTVAQTLIGITENTVNKKYVGFWYQSRELLNSVTWVAPTTDADQYKLEQSFPNPAQSAITIPFSVPYPAKISLAIANVSGKILGLAAEGELASGAYMAQYDASGLPAGVYYYLLYANGGLKDSGSFVVNR